MIKDLIVLSVVASLLIILPLIRSYGFNNSYGSVSSLEQDQVASEARRTHAKPQEIIEDMAFIEEVFPKVSAWEMTKFEPYLAAETRSEARTREIGYVLDTLATRLGELEHFTQPQPMTIAELSTDSDGDELSAYEFVAYYETGVAGINLVLGEDDGESALYSFNINIQDKLRVL
tara:strand:+ start:761 stop:1285 length:525 start_codon:yes stop_codon:yes gene_type:complete